MKLSPEPCNTLHTPRCHLRVPSVFARTLTHTLGFTTSSSASSISGRPSHGNQGPGTFIPAHLRNRANILQVLSNQNLPPHEPSLDLFSGSDKESVIDANLRLAWPWLPHVLLCGGRQCQRKELKKKDCTIYGIASNGYDFIFLKIDNDSKVSLFGTFDPSNLTCFNLY